MRTFNEVFEALKAEGTEFHGINDALWAICNAFEEEGETDGFSEYGHDIDSKSRLIYFQWREKLVDCWSWKSRNIAIFKVKLSKASVSHGWYGSSQYYRIEAIEPYGIVETLNITPQDALHNFKVKRHEQKKEQEERAKELKAQDLEKLSNLGFESFDSLTHSVVKALEALDSLNYTTSLEIREKIKTHLRADGFYASFRL